MPCQTMLQKTVWYREKGGLWNQADMRYMQFNPSTATEQLNNPGRTVV